MSHSSIDQLIGRALAEDIGPGDRTSEALLPAALLGRARIVAKSAGVVCGVEVARQVFSIIDSAIKFDAVLTDGARVSGGRDIIADVSGSLRGILIAERTALNFLQRMSGVASLAAQFADAVVGSGAEVVDTRKTIPGLRELDKYAARVGGVRNHRFGLFDGILIKDNHIAAVGSIAECVASARASAPHTLRVEVEAKSLPEVREAVDAGADIILLDNMPCSTLAEAVRLVAGRALCEASGGVTLDTVRAVAATGVNLISVGAITHSAAALDISLDVVGGEE